MRITELLRLVWLNINQNKFKSVMTSIGIVVGAATIVLVIGIGRGGQMDVAEQFAELNAGAVDISYEYAGEDESRSGSFSFGNLGRFFGNMFGGGGTDSGNAGGFGQGNGFDPGAGENGFGGENGGNSFGPGADGNSFRREDGGGSFGPGANGDGFGQESGEGGFGGRKGENESSDSEEEGKEHSDSGNGAGRSGEGAPAENRSGEEKKAEDSDGTDQTDESGKDQAEAESEGEPETSMVEERLNQEKVILTVEDVEDIETFVSDITGATISYSTRGTVEGGNLTASQNYTVAGVLESYMEVSKLTMAEGFFLSDEDSSQRSRVCVLGSSAAAELFGTSSAAKDGTIYIDDRTYTVVGVLNQSGTVASGISVDTSIFVPYETGIKYIAGEEIDPVITVVARGVDVLDEVIAGAKNVLEANYSNARFEFEDSGSKMQAAESSNQILTMLLSAMAFIVFLVGGIGIMNVLFVSVKERTNEIGILKAVGTPKSDILLEFLIESAAISLIGGILGVIISFIAIPVAERFGVRVEADVSACLTALGFAVLTGTVFGIYPAWKASRLEPVEALNAE